MSKKIHTVSTDDYEDFAPELRLAGCHGVGSSKTLDVEVTFIRDINSGRPVGRTTFIVRDKISGQSDFISEFLDAAITDYNARP